jgi:quercetin dioxygenase-like cupin family protein
LAPQRRAVALLGGVLARVPHREPQLRHRQESAMPFIDTQKLKVIERLPGWHGRYFHSKSMTFAHYEFTRGSSIHEHFHPEEEVYEVIDGELELTIDGETRIARAGVAAIVPSNARHSVKALTDGRAIIVDHPARPEFG